MSASGLSYHLRPGKFVDRELFAEFIAQLVSASDPGRYVYLSMGGPHLSDHRAIYRRSGVRSLYSFDLADEVVGRQRFFRPFEEVRCEVHSSVELPQRIDDILAGFGGDQAIVWLDFTQSIRSDQLGEVRTLAGRLQPGDVLRVTLTFEPRDDQKMAAELPKRDRTKGELLADYLRHKTGEYLPTEIRSLDYNRIPGALSECVRRACERGIVGDAGISVTPALLTTYRDTTRMFVATVLFQDREGMPAIPPGWKFRPEAWDSILPIKLPNLTPTEKSRFDEHMHLSADELREKTGFPLTEDGRDQEVLDHYRHLHRFYPVFESLSS